MTEEAATDLETLIKQRITSGRFDDVVRLEAPPLERTRTQLDLDDNKSNTVGWGGEDGG